MPGPASRGVTRRHGVTRRSELLCDSWSLARDSLVPPSPGSELLTAREGAPARPGALAGPSRLTRLASGYVCPDNGLVNSSIVAEPHPLQVVQTPNYLSPITAAGSGSCPGPGTGSCPGSDSGSDRGQCLQVRVVCVRCDAACPQWWRWVV